MKPYQPLEMDMIGVIGADILTVSDAEPLDKISVDPIGEGVVFTWKQ